jgi:hypothetical protein
MSEKFTLSAPRSVRRWLVVHQCLPCGSSHAAILRVRAASFSATRRVGALQQPWLQRAAVAALAADVMRARASAMARQTPLLSRGSRAHVALHSSAVASLGQGSMSGRLAVAGGSLRRATWTSTGCRPRPPAPRGDQADRRGPVHRPAVRPAPPRRRSSPDVQRVEMPATTCSVDAQWPGSRSRSAMQTPLAVERSSGLARVIPSHVTPVFH